MYRIELAPGEEALFKSIDEMAAGIANGVISSRARIWHQTSAKWLPIEFHPHYKIALTKGPQAAPKAEYRESPAVAGPAAVAPAPIFEKAASRPSFDAPAPKPIFGAAAPAPELASLRPLFDEPVRSPYARPSSAATFEQPAPPVIESQPAFESMIAETERQAATATLDEPFAPLAYLGGTQPRGRTMTIGIVAAAAVVLLGGGAAFSAFRSRSAPPAKAAIAAPASYGAQPVIPNGKPSFGARSDGPKADSIVATKPLLEEKPAKIADAPTITEAPKFAISTVGISDADRPASDRPTGVTAAVLVAHYAAAYEAARAEADKGLRFAGLGTLFTAPRLGAGGVAAARNTVAGATNVLRVYRKRVAVLEQTYRDSMNLLSRQNSWSAAQVAVWENRPTQLESPDMAGVANNILDAIDGALDVLGAHEGGYEVSNSTITFRDAQAARDYGVERRRVASLIDTGADSGTPAGRLVRAIGSSRLPDERTGS